MPEVALSLAQNIGCDAYIEKEFHEASRMGMHS